MERTPPPSDVYLPRPVAESLLAEIEEAVRLARPESTMRREDAADLLDAAREKLAAAFAEPPPNTLPVRITRELDAMDVVRAMCDAWGFTSGDALRALFQGESPPLDDTVQGYAVPDQADARLLDPACLLPPCLDPSAILSALSARGLIPAGEYTVRYRS